jgi:hypothetical protein
MLRWIRFVQCDLHGAEFENTTEIYVSRRSAEIKAILEGKDIDKVLTEGAVIDDLWKKYFGEEDFF